MTENTKRLWRLLLHETGHSTEALVPVVVLPAENRKGSVSLRDIPDWSHHMQCPSLYPVKIARLRRKNLV